MAEHRKLTDYFWIGFLATLGAGGALITPLFIFGFYIAWVLSLK